MKKLTLLIATIFCITSAFAQTTGAGADGGSQTVYGNSFYTYEIEQKQHDDGNVPSTMVDDTYAWQVFSDAGCTSEVLAAANTFTFQAGTENTNAVGVTWNVPDTYDATYYLRVKAVGAHGCYNLTTITITVTDPAGSMDFAYTDSPASSEDCAGNLSGGADLDINVTLSGASLVHETARPAQVFYAITTTNGTDVAGKYLDVNTTAATGEGAYTITIPKAELFLDGNNLTTDGVFSITVSKLKDGAGTEITLPVAQTYTYTAQGLPVISPIKIK